MPAWLTVVVSLGTGTMAAFALLFSMADGGVSARAAVISSAVAAVLAFLATIWIGWAHWCVTQERARRHTPTDGHP
jgi:hypothetical protein